MIKKHPLLGGHVSAAGGLHRAIENGEMIGAEAIQIFGASPRQWHARMPDSEDVSKFREARGKSRIKAVYLHAPYLVNLASSDSGMLQKSVKNLSDHLRIAELLEADGLIFHVGSGKEAPRAEAIEKAAAALKIILGSVPGKARLVIENSAGGGQKLGSSPQDIRELMERVASPRVKACFDTAHAFEAGLIEKYEPPQITALLKEWDGEVGLGNIAALHVNDSKTAFNSHHDRHENLGKGHIGLEGFRNLAKAERLWDKAWLLEVPGFADLGPDKENMEILRSCFAV